MRKLSTLLFVLMLTILFPARADGESCYSRAGAPYWHRDAGCGFAETGWYAETSSPLGEVRLIAVDEAEAEGQKPCPGCATAFLPTFTGDYDGWTGGIAPWGYEHGALIGEADGWPVYAGEVPAEVRQAWGNAAGRIDSMFPETEDPDTGEPVYGWPDDYAGIFVNACGGYTLLLKDPTLERVAEWHELLGCEFWVIAARYSGSELQALRLAASGLMDADSRLRDAGAEAYYHIVSISTDEIGNAVGIGVVTEHFDAGVSRITKALAEAGFDDPGMIRFTPAGYPTWGDF